MNRYEHHARILSRVMASREIGRLVDALRQTRLTGRPGYEIGVMVGMAFVRAQLRCNSWKASVAAVAGSRALADAIGLNDGQVPSVWACYRFAAKLRAHPALLEQCGESFAAAARAVVPGCGTKLALTSIDVPAFPNGHRTTIWAGQIVDRTSHPDANRGPVSSAISRSDRMIYGYKLRAAVCQRTGLPLAWRFTPTRVPTRRFPAVPLPDLGPCAILAPERVRFRLRNPIPARPGRRGTRNRAVPFGTRGMPSARLLVDLGLIVRLAHAVATARAKPADP